MTEGLELADRWLLSRLNQVIGQTRELLDNYGFGEAAKGLYEFIWGDFCDWYIELVKSRLWQKEDSPERRGAQATLAWALDRILRLLHPFMPHITEELWQTLSQREGEFLPRQSYPEVNPDWIDPDLERSFTLLFGAVRVIRNLRAEAGIKPGVKAPVILQSENPQEREILAQTQTYLQDLAKVESLTLTERLERENLQCIAGVVDTVQVLIPLSGLVDLDALRAKLEKNLAKIEKEAQGLENRLNNPGFTAKAPPEVLEGNRQSLAEARKQMEILQRRLQSLEGGDAPAKVP